MNRSAAENYPVSSSLLGLSIHQVTVLELHAYIEKVIRENRKALVLNCNVQAVNLACGLPWLKIFFQRAQLVFCDGDGVRWGMKILGLKVPPKITYAAWMWQLAEFCQEKQLSLYLLGSKPGVAEKAGARLKARYPDLKVLGTHHGYFNHEGPENEKVIAEINRLKPDILLVGFGMPLQEMWLQKYWERLDCGVFLTGGAVFDYTSGNLKRAPRWMLALHLEWLFRLFQEPGRLFKRYVIGNPLFFMRILKERLTQK